MFWMVYGEGGRTPAFKHPTEGAARLEAARLARSNAGTRFYVLATIADVVTDDIVWHDYKTEPTDIPF